ncbi:hypothetical protein [Raoultella ornithinolytica]|uniref:hypothetical protein n=1 Tax=Raoultella ornithinolytica TaxID=54291 RepID=UPI0021AF04FA|nr:hypothetical protein [Raoultella ornithinolytica]MCT4737212.1 hypothetical protein [Raoultella ornithinolytica]
MKRVRRRKYSQWRVVAGVVMAGLVWLVWAETASAANDTTISSDILQGSCTLTIQNAGTGAPIASFSLGKYESADLNTTGAMVGFKPVKLALSGCGSGGGALTPKVELKGTQAQITDVASANIYTFRNAGADGGDSHGYFIFVANSTTAKWNPVSQTGSGDGVWGTGMYIPMAAAGTSGEGASKTLYLGVGCYSDCLASGTYAGTVKASLVFEFAYK